MFAAAGGMNVVPFLFFSGLGECGVGVVSPDFGSDFTMLGSNSVSSSANNRYQLQHPSAPAGSAGVSPGSATAGEQQYTSGNLHQQQQQQNNGLIPTTASSISSGQLFHHGIGHFTSPAATYIPTG